MSKVTARLRGLIRGDGAVERLDAAQIAHIRSIAENVATKAKLPKSRAESLANAIAQRLKAH